MKNLTELIERGVKLLKEINPYDKNPLSPGIVLEIKFIEYISHL